MRLGNNKRIAMCRFEHGLALLLLLFVSTIAIHVLVDSPAQGTGGAFTEAPWPQRFGWVLKLIGIFLGLACMFHARELVSLFKDFYAQVKLQRKLNWLCRLRNDSEPYAKETSLQKVLDHLRGGDTWTLQRHAIAAAYCLVRANPSLVEKLPGYRALFERMVFLEPGFSRTLKELGAKVPLTELITLGGKLGAGSLEKRISSVTSDPCELALWILAYRDSSRLQELQIAIGYDTGGLPYLEERGKFLALYLFVATTDLDRFQALTSNPRRDPNAAFGLLIRGDRIEVRYPGQQTGRRLDYVFPCPREMSLANLTHFLRGFQLLNLGLLLATTQDLCATFFPGESFAWFTPRMERIAETYRSFERGFISLLRQHDAHRDPEMIFELDPIDHAERVEAFLEHRLEECLYPNYSWVVPLYSEDTRWNRLVAPLRGIEAMMLHQGDVPGKEVTRGLHFIHQVRLLGYQTVTALEEESPLVEDEPPFVSCDPFLDFLHHREATEDYLQRMETLIAQGEVSVESLPDPVGYRRALRSKQFSQTEEV